jgi:hypothetical protein
MMTAAAVAAVVAEEKAGIMKNTVAAMKAAVVNRDKLYYRFRIETDK